MIRFKNFTHLSFDCYGTLIDWETGILAALTPVLKRHTVDVEPECVLKLYARFEAEQEAEPYQPLIAMCCAMSQLSLHPSWALRQPRRILTRCAVPSRIGHRFPTRSRL